MREATQLDQAKEIADRIHREFPGQERRVVHELRWRAVELGRYDADDVLKLAEKLLAFRGHWQ